MNRFPFLKAPPAYLGSKAGLVRLIFGLLDETLPRDAWADEHFLDPMCGSASVALTAKRLGFSVTAGDVAVRGLIPARALVANSSRRLQRADIVALLAGASRRTEAPDPAIAELLPPDLACLLTRALAYSQEQAEPLASLLLLLLQKAFLRAFPMSLPSATDAAHAASGDFDAISSRRVGHYVRARHAFDPDVLLTIAREINAGIFPGTGTAVQGTAVDVIRTCPADIVYLDPPYPGTTDYRAAYRPLDQLLGDTALEAPPPGLDVLLDAARDAPFVLVSHGGPRTTLDDLTRTIAKHRRVVRGLAVPYPHLASVATEDSRRRARELLVLAGR